MKQVCTLIERQGELGNVRAGVQAPGISWKTKSGGTSVGVELSPGNLREKMEKADVTLCRR